MPIYPYQCQECGYEFDVLSRTFEPGPEACPKCRSENTKRIMGAFSISSGKMKDVPTKYLETEVSIKRHLENKRPDLAVKEARKDGRKHGEVAAIKKGTYSPKIIE